MSLSVKTGLPRSYAQGDNRFPRREEPLPGPSAQFSTASGSGSPVILPQDDLLDLRRGGPTNAMVVSSRPDSVSLLRLQLAKDFRRML